MGLPGIVVKLTGIDTTGQAVSTRVVTDAAGNYVFRNMLSGTYKLVESGPAAFTDGRETLGSVGGVVGNDVFRAIALGPATKGINYNFGELLTISKRLLLASTPPLLHHPAAAWPSSTRRLTHQGTSTSTATATAGATPGNLASPAS